MACTYGMSRSSIALTQGQGQTEEMTLDTLVHSPDKA